MKHRKLRIAFSAVCGVLCLLLSLLWVRSYSWADDIRWSRYCTVLGSNSGRLYLYKTKLLVLLAPEPGVLKYSRYTAYEPWWITDSTSRFAGDYAICVPTWCAVAVAAAVAGVPWVTWRFSLRTLLLAMTVLALVLGFIITTTR
jgi:hypothetical protein